MHIVHRANKNMTALKQIHYLPTFSFSGDWWLDQWMMLLHLFSPTLLHLQKRCQLVTKITAHPIFCYYMYQGVQCDV